MGDIVLLYPQFKKSGNGSILLYNIMPKFPPEKKIPALHSFSFGGGSHVSLCKNNRPNSKETKQDKNTRHLKDYYILM